LNIFSELFPSGEILNSASNKIESTKVLSADISDKESTRLFASVVNQPKLESKREKSKPLQVTKIIPIHKTKKIKDQWNNQVESKPDESLEKKIESVKSEVEKLDEILDLTKPLSTIERLRIEALGLESKKNKSKEIPLPRIKKETGLKSTNESSENRDIDFNAISQMNVHKLRHYAREFPNFPIKGREISRANRSELVELFRTIKNN
jgi:hypothetical protein